MNNFLTVGRTLDWYLFFFSLQLTLDRVRVNEKQNVCGPNQHLYFPEMRRDVFAASGVIIIFFLESVKIPPQGQGHILVRV